MIVSDIDLAWSAGFIDGEGTITIERNKVQLLPHISAANTDIRGPQKLKELFGGSIHKLIRTNINYSDIYTWKVLSGKAVEVCELLLPYLVIKQEQAQFLILFQTVTAEQGHHTTDAEKEVRAVIFGKVRLLNKRGRSA